jgi:hypothetical protein
MMSDDEIIAVVQAHNEGKAIEWRPKNWKGDTNSEWKLDDRGPREPDFNFYSYDYRVKREPREWTVPEPFWRGSNEIYNSTTVEMIHVREVLENE